MSKKFTYLARGVSKIVGRAILEYGMGSTGRALAADANRESAQRRKLFRLTEMILFVLRFDGQAPIHFTNDHFNGKVWLTSNNPVVKATMEPMGSFIKAENAAQGKPNGNK